MRVTKRATLAIVMAFGLILAVAQPAQAAYYNTYSDIAATPDAQGATSTQAFAAGSTYLYSVKVKGDNSRSVIYRVNKSTGKRELMTNGTDKRSYNTWLGHANDMTIVDIDGKHHFFVVTMKASGAQLVKLRYDGTKYYKVGQYSVKFNGATKAVSGVNRVSVTSKSINFFFKSGRTVFNGSLPLRANSGTVKLTKAFNLKIAGAKVDGKAVAGLSGYSNQGFFYDPAKKVFYYPLTKDNRSVVLVYRNITTASRGEAPSASNLSFRITSAKYKLFEIESLGISGGRLYFNTNRSNSSDGIHQFKGYQA